MIGVSMKIAQSEEKEIEWIDVEVTDTNSPDFRRKLRLKEGTEVKVDPLNPVKMKHRDREGVFVGVTYDEKGHLEAAKIKFDDTKRVGKVDFGDLIEK